MSQLIELILIAIGLSFDTFAVSISTGLTNNKIRFIQGVKVALVLAFFQTLMPLIGWLGGVQVGRLMSDFDHWIAFGLLFLLGVKMIADTFEKEEERKINPMMLSVLIYLGLATSVDALVVGVSLALISTDIYLALAVIGFTTFMAAMIGMLLGKNATGKLGKNIEVLGGLILIGIGTKILIEHLS